ncbi:hypothetical protein GQ600_16707 [Phytophthora cactorum]|nr:hypothetical protein GQ600_16707 [Phytophthora cactorum]
MEANVRRRRAPPSGWGVPTFSPGRYPSISVSDLLRMVNSLSDVGINQVQRASQTMRRKTKQPIIPVGPTDDDRVFYELELSLVDSLKCSIHAAIRARWGNAQDTSSLVLNITATHLPYLKAPFTDVFCRRRRLSLQLSALSLAVGETPLHFLHLGELRRTP